MANKRHKPEEIVTKLRQVDVLVGQGMARDDAILEVRKVEEQTQRRWRRVWTISGVLAGLLCFMPSLITLCLVVVYAVTGSALWVTYEAPLMPGDFIGFPIIMLIANWPVLVLRTTTRRAQARGDNPQKVLVYNCSVLLTLAAANVIFWIGTPEELLSDARDAGQGTGLLAAVMVLASPFKELQNRRTATIRYSLSSHLRWNRCFDRGIDRG